MTEEEIKRVLELSNEYVEYVSVFFDEQQELWFSIRHDLIFEKLLGGKIKELPVKDGFYEMAFINGISDDAHENPPFRLLNLGLPIIVFKKENDNWVVSYKKYPNKITIDLD